MAFFFERRLRRSECTVLPSSALLPIIFPSTTKRGLVPCHFGDALTADSVRLRRYVFVGQCTDRSILCSDGRVDVYVVTFPCQRDVSGRHVSSICRRQCAAICFCFYRANHRPSTLARCRRARH